MYKNSILDKLDRKIGRFAIPNLMTVVVFAMALVFLIDSFTAQNPDYSFSLGDILPFNRDAILAERQYWRILTFIFIPPETNILFLAFTLYLYWLIGSAIEQQWGAFRFNIYYLTGTIGNIIAGFIVGYADNYFMSMSLFLAFAALFPNYEIRLFFIIPIKMKYLALLDTLYLLYFLVIGSWEIRAAVIVSLLNFILFFGASLVRGCFAFFRRKRFQKKSQRWGNKQSHWWEDKNNQWWDKK